jgi:hypothetical protein
MVESGKPTHQDSAPLWAQMAGSGVDGSFKAVLTSLDTYQANEDISPDLAETIRDMFFQLSQENAPRLNALNLRAMTPSGPSLKFILTQLEDGGGNYRLRKSAELVGEKTKRHPQSIMGEYLLWQSDIEE